MSDETQNGLNPEALNSNSTNMREVVEARVKKEPKLWGDKSKGEKTTLDPDQMQRLVEERKKTIEEKYGNDGSEVIWPFLPASSSDGDKEGVKHFDPKFILSCIEDFSNMLGPGLMYAHLNENLIFLQLPTEKVLIKNSSNVWVHDHGKIYLSSVEKVVDELLRFYGSYLQKEMHSAIKSGDKGRLEQLQKAEKDVFKIVKKLRSINGRKDCVLFGFVNPYFQLSATVDQFDNNPGIFPAKNINVCLESGRPIKRRPEDKITFVSSAEFHLTEHFLSRNFEDCPTFGEFLISLWPGKEGHEIILYLQRLFGYVLTGSCVEHIIIVLSGIGRNGKSTLIELMAYILGDLAGNFQPELLLDQYRVRNPDAPSPSIMAFMNKLLMWASESDPNRRWNTQIAKSFSGGDTRTGREVHGKNEISFQPTHTIFFLCNHLPIAPANDFAFWERIHVIPFKRRFILNRDPDPRDPNEIRADKGLPEKLKKESNAILAWMIAGCLYWRKEGLKPPLAVREATAKYKRDEDILQDWIDEACVLHKDARGPASLLHESFNEWYTKNLSKKGITPHKFGRLMGQRFEKIKPSGYVYVGIGLKDEKFS